MATVTNLTAVGAALRRIRQSQQKSLMDVSKLAKVNDGNLSRMERGDAGWSLDTLAAIASALSVSVSEVFAEAERESGSTIVSVILPVVNLDDLHGGITAAIRKAKRFTRASVIVGSKSFAFLYKGNAMPEFSGELVVIDPDVTPTFGQHVLVLTEEEVMFRKLDVEGSKSYLYATNKQYAALPLKRTHKIFGVARQAIRDL